MLLCIKYFSAKGYVYKNRTRGKGTYKRLDQSIINSGKKQELMSDLMLEIN